MATTRLSLCFEKSDGDSITMFYSNAKKDVNAADVKALMESIVTNGVIFEKIPAVIKSARVVTTESKAINVN